MVKRTSRTKKNVLLNFNSKDSSVLIDVPIESMSNDLQNSQTVGVVAAPKQPHDQC